MKRYIFNGYIDKESVDKFISFVDTNPGEHITIYLTSSGGEEAGMIVMLDVINHEPERFEIYAIERIFSCAFHLFFQAKCHRRLAIAVLGMCHLSTCDMKMMGNGEPSYDGDKALLKADRFRNADLTALCAELGISEEDYQKIMKGEDVYFQWDHLIGLMQHQKNFKSDSKSLAPS
jgi:hypothetical protein